MESGDSSHQIYHFAKKYLIISPDNNDFSESPNDLHETEFRALIDHFPNGVIVLFDTELRHQAVGPEAIPFSDLHPSEIVGKTIYELLPQKIVDQLEPELQATIEGDSRSFDIEYGERIHHIETRPVQLRGEPHGLLISQDVTEEHQSVRQLQRQNERLDQFASMISHDLRNLLSLAMGQLSEYRDTGDASNLDEAEDSLRRIDELSGDLLMVARSESPPDECVQVNIEDIAWKAWQLVDSRSARLETGAGTVSCDPGQLQALLENLFRNAVGHGGAHVTVRVMPTGNGFYVEDTGSGIAPEIRHEIFDHGFSTGYGGTGVGLTIVRRVAESYGWEVSVSESPERGARFEFVTGENT